MSLVKTLAKVAIGMAVAKGVSHVAKNGLPGRSTAEARQAPQRGGQSGQGGGFDDLVGQLGGMIGGTSSRAGAGSKAGAGGLGDLLGGMLGGGGGAGGGLGSLLEGLAGGGASARKTTRRASAPTGLEGMLGAGGVGGLLGGLLGGASAGGGAGGLGSMLDAVLQGGSPAAEPSRDQELAAALMLRAMIQAVKADGDLDAEEKRKLMAALEGASEEEVAFVNAELSAPQDLDSLVALVPQGMEAQVYAISLSAIDLDNRAEAQYLHSLATALDLDQAEVNALHDKMGAQRIYG